MDFVVKRGDLLRELQYVQGVVEKKTTVPILSNILLETAGNALQLTATDLDVTIRCHCPAEVKVSGALTVSARKLFDIVRLLPDSEVHFKLSGTEWIQVTCVRSRFKIASLSKDNFPDIPAVEAELLELPAASVRHMITSCVFAITQEESRFALNGALLIIKPGGLSMVTTDGHRLALINRELKLSGVKDEQRNLIPRKTLVELAKLAADEAESIGFGRTDNHFFFTIGERLLVSRVLSGQFPNYEMVIPTNNTTTLLIDTGLLADAIRRVSVMADEQSRAIRFSLEEGQLDISSSGSDFGEAKETIPIDFQGDGFEVCFNASYMLDFLGGLQSEQVEISLRDSESQGLFKPSEGGNYDYRYVVMPMKM